MTGTAVAMGNSASALAGVVEKLMVEGDVSDLADDAWGAILGGGDQPPMSPADVRAVFSDDVLREARAKKPKNLLAVMLRALERAEAALEPDAPKEGAPALGATVAPADAPTVLACVRLLARIVPFVAASVEEEEEDPSDDSTNDEPADVRRFSRTLWGESEDAPLAPALPWRRHVALLPEERCSAAADAEETLQALRRADVAFGSRGIQSYLFEGALAELSARVAAYMDALTGGALTLALAPAAVGEGQKNARKTRVSKKPVSSKSTSNDSFEVASSNDVHAVNAVGEGSFDADADDSASSDDAESRSGSAFGGASAEKIEKIVHAHGADGARARRSLRQLSGGERRRAALALALAHADLAASRGGVHCDLLVLDEVLQHLDAEGIARVAAALRAMPRGTVLLTSQADSATSHLFDTVDRVFKRGGSAGVATASGASLGLGEANDAEDEARFAEHSEETA